ncbi:MAG: CPBP family intramembrane metalloprotease [Mollicutes bacterium]|nr:CPBP family intramembrane metalloprotease [Mollicutes bacterium]
MRGLDYFKRMAKVLVWPIVFVVSQILFLGIFTFFFNLNLNMNSQELETYIITEEYRTKLINYLNDYKLLITLILVIIFLPIFIKLYQKYKPKEKVNLTIRDISLLSILGITIFFIFNTGLVIFNHLFKIIEFNPIIFSEYFFVSILCTGIMGPILEEYLFRGIVYNELKTFESKKNATILASLIFALVHTNYINMIYAFFISFILIKIYDKYQTIKASFIVHIFLNTSNFLFFRFIVYNHFIVNSFILVGMIIIFICTFRKIIKEN